MHNPRLDTTADKFDEFLFESMVSILEKAAVREAARPITVRQYHQLTEAGIIPEKTELIGGVIVDKMGKSPRHTQLVEFLVDLLRKHLGADYYVRQEQPLTLPDSEPEPDIAVIKAKREEFFERHPSTAELIVEVAISTESLDKEKAELYATAGVPECWLLSPRQNTAEIYTRPSSSSYRSCVVLGPADRITSARFSGLSIDCSQLIR